MEYASGGELYDYLNRMKRIPESQARAIFRQIVSAVHFLHKVKHCFILFSMINLHSIDILESNCSSRS
jgi:serine/threonine protein kinase